MSLRTKLFILLVALSVLPVLGLRLRGQALVESVAKDLAQRSGQVLQDKAREQLRLLVQDQAALLHREGQLLEQTLRLQALAVEAALAGADGPDIAQAHALAGQTAPDLIACQATALENGQFGSTSPWPPGADPRQAPWYLLAKAKGELDWSAPAQDPATGRVVLTVSMPVRGPGGQVVGVCAVMAPVDLMAQRRPGGESLPASLTALVVYPEEAAGQTAARLRILAQTEERPEADAPADATPAPAPASALVPATPPAQTPAAPPALAPAAPSAPPPAQAPAAPSAPPPAQAPAAPSASAPAQAPAAPSASPPAAPQAGKAAMVPAAQPIRSPSAPLPPRWLTPDSPADLERLTADILVGAAGTMQAAYRGADHLWAYASADLKGAALVFLAPMTEMTAESAAAQTFIEAHVAQQMHTTWYLVLLALALVTAAAWTMSRSMARPLVELQEAARRMAQGDFEARVTPTGGGELEELGRVFNAVAPQLKERLRLSQAMLLARQVQADLLPRAMPSLAGLDLAGISIPCDETGGDYFDAIQGVGGDPRRTALVLGDVSGHGVDAALFMTTARAYLRLRAQQPGGPAQVAAEVNRQLCRDTADTGRFMTLFYLEVCPQGLAWVRAGHDPALLYTPSGGDFEELGGNGVPLGVLAEHDYQLMRREALKAGQVLLIGSDGLWEARNPAGEMFGQARVRRVLAASAHGSARHVADSLLAAQKAFMNRQAARDDVTLLVIKAV